MRVTNSMLVNNFMRNLNSNLTNLDRLANQEASGRKYAHISDDPIAFLYSSAARNRIHRLDHYQGAVDNAQDWLASAESSMRDLQERIADVYVSLVDATTDGKNSTDKTNIAMLVAQLRDHYLDTLNSTFGDKYLFAGYNTPGEESTPGTGGSKITGPFSIDDNWNLYYNGHNLSNFLELEITTTPNAQPSTTIPVNPNSVSSIFGGLNLNVNSKSVGGIAQDARDAIDAANLLIWNASGTPGTADASGIPGTGGTLGDRGIKGANMEIAAYQDGPLAAAANALKLQENEIIRIENEIAQYDYFVYDPVLEGLKSALQTAKDALPPLQMILSSAEATRDDMIHERQKLIDDLAKIVNIDAPIISVDNMVSLSLGGVFLLSPSNVPADFPDGWAVGVLGDTTSTDPDASILTDMNAKVAMVNQLRADVLTFDVGAAVSMPVTFNGIDLVLFETTNSNGAYGSINIFNLLNDIYKAASSGESVSDASDTRASDLAQNLTLFISELQQSQNHLLTKVAEIGGRTRRLDLLTSRYEADFINYTQMQSDAEDVDMAEVIMYFKMAEAVYQASLSAGARIIQPTLMDFLK